MYQTEGELCRRHAPSPTTTEREPAKWPRRHSTSVCGEGSVDRGPVLCGDCVYWQLSGGNALRPETSTDQRLQIWASEIDEEWWDNARECVHHTVGPGRESEMFHPRVCHATDSCGSGKTPEQMLEEAKGQK